MARLPDRAGDAAAVPRRSAWRHPAVAGRRRRRRRGRAPKKQALDDLRAFVAPTCEGPRSRCRSGRARRHLRLPQDDRGARRLPGAAPAHGPGGRPRPSRSRPAGCPATAPSGSRRRSPLTIADHELCAADPLRARGRTVRRAPAQAGGRPRQRPAPPPGRRPLRRPPGRRRRERHQAPERGHEHRRAQGRSRSSRSTRPDEQGLPALQTAGIAVVRPDVRSRLAEIFRRMHAINHAPGRRGRLAVRAARVRCARAASRPTSCSPRTSCAGYRIDIRDTKATGWLSLCRRVGHLCVPRRSAQDRSRSRTRGSSRAA